MTLQTSKSIAIMVETVHLTICNQLVNMNRYMLIIHCVTLWSLISLDPVASQSDSELRAATEAIWAADDNSFPPGEVVFNLDNTNGGPLFESVNEERLETGTYPTYMDLLYLFNPKIGEEEPEHSDNVTAFLDAVIQTATIQTAHAYLVDWGLADADIEVFKEELRYYWFTLYSKAADGVTLDSSGFQRVFLGELLEDVAEVGGFHNWLQAYKEEQDGFWTYEFLEDDCNDGLVLLSQFGWRGSYKPISSLWISRSPELDLALYTVCFLTRMDQLCTVSVDNGKIVDITNYPQSGISPSTVGTAYYRC